MAERPTRPGAGDPRPGPLEPAEVERRLRAALDGEARALHPHPGAPDPAGLQRILDRAAEHRSPGRAAAQPSSRPSAWPSGRPSRGRWARPLALSAAVAAAVAGLILLPGQLRPPGPEPVPPAVAIAPAPLPVYYAQDGPSGWRLVREFSTTTATGADRRVEEAVRLALAGRAADPDLSSAWRATGLPVARDGAATVDVGPDLIVLRLDPALFGADRRADAAATAGGSGPADLGRIAVQQLVWTATAAAGRNVPVEVRSSAGPTPGTMFGTEPLTVASRPDTAADPRAPIWISSVTDGERVPGGRPIRVTGDLDAPAAAEPLPPRWRVDRVGGSPVPAGTPVAAGTVTQADPQVPPARTLWELQLPALAPGEYLLSVSYWNWTDTKRIVVTD